MGDFKPERACAAGAVHQRMKVTELSDVVRCLYPEGDEIRELLAHRIAGFKGKATCGQPIGFAGADATEIAGTLEHSVFV